jgi:hypothetical protein
MVRFEVFRAVTLKSGVFYDFTPCGATSQKKTFFIYSGVGICKQITILILN